MKKVLVLAAAVLMFSGIGFALITGSAHDLAGTTAADNSEMCIYCHTPHGGDQANGPLWNHEVTLATYQVYASPTLVTPAGTNPGSVSLACLSCHDGSVAVDSFGGNAGIVNIDTYTNGATQPAGYADLGTDLRNDHPVGMNQATVAGSDAEILAVPANAAVILFGTGEVECASCHDVHNTLGLTDLLVTSNAASALCFDCHIK